MSWFFNTGQLVPLLAFSFFIVCPRMAAMTNILARSQAGGGIYTLVILGTVVSLPLLLLTAWAIRQWGLMAGLALAILTDLAASALLAGVDTKLALETLIIAGFVVAGNRVAMWVTSLW